MEDLHSGAITPANLNVDLFTQYKNELLTAASKGFGTDLLKINYDTPDYALLSKMKSNLYGFAGAKTYSQLKEINSLLYDAAGKIVSFNEFKRNASIYYKSIGIIDQKYFNWLKVEYDTAIAQGTKARQWQEFMQNIDIYRNLKYVTANDDKVRPLHAILNNIVLAKTDPYVDKIIPIKDFGCRCDMIETNEPVTFNPPIVNFDGPFSGNVGKDGIVISKSHPYYPTAKKALATFNNSLTQLITDDKISINKAIYNQYAKDSSYKQILFNEKTGGSLIKHIGADTLSDSEQKVVDLLVKNGERVILPELKKAPYTKSFDLLVNDAQFEIKTITGNTKSQTEQNIKASMTQANNALLYFDKKVNIAELKRGLGNVKSSTRLNAVMISSDDIMTIITKKEIIAGDYSSLDRLQ